MPHFGLARQILFAWLISAVIICAWYRSATAAASPCVGDCDGGGSVTVDEIITLVNIALDNAQPSACPNGVPSGAEVNIAIILQAVNDALNGCVAAQTETTGSDGTASFPNASLTVRVLDIASQQPLPGLRVTSLQQGNQVAFWVSDPTGQYLSGFFVPPNTGAPALTATNPIYQSAIQDPPGAYDMMVSRVQMGTDEATSFSLVDNFWNFVQNNDDCSNPCLTPQEADAKLAQVLTQGLIDSVAPGATCSIDSLQKLNNVLETLLQGSCSRKQGSLSDCDSQVTAAVQDNWPAFLSSCGEVPAVDAFFQLPVWLNLGKQVSSEVDHANLAYTAGSFLPGIIDGLYLKYLECQGDQNFYVCTRKQNSPVNLVPIDVAPFLVRPCGPPPPTSGSASVRVQVTDVTTGSGISGSFVTVTDLCGLSKSIFTGDAGTDGAYTFDGIVPGYMSISANASGYISGYTTASPQNGQTMTVSVPLEQTAIYGVQFSGNASGQYVDYSVSVTGTGFGSAATPYCCNTPHFIIHNVPTLNLGNFGFTGDWFGLNYKSWTETEIDVDGLTGAGVEPGSAVWIGLQNPSTGAVAAWGGNIPPVPPGNPRIISVQFGGSGQNLTMKIVGSGFGAPPPGVPGTGNTPFLGFEDWSRRCFDSTGSPVLFDAGNGGVLLGDEVYLNYSSWSDTEIDIAGFGGVYGQSNCLTVQPGDPVTITIFNTEDSVPQVGLQTAWGGFLPGW